MWMIDLMSYFLFQELVMPKRPDKRPKIKFRLTGASIGKEKAVKQLLSPDTANAEPEDMDISSPPRGESPPMSPPSPVYEPTGPTIDDGDDRGHVSDGSPAAVGGLEVAGESPEDAEAASAVAGLLAAEAADAAAADAAAEEFGPEPVIIGSEFWNFFWSLQSAL